MRRNWSSEELVAHWTLLPAEMELLANKTGPTRRGFAVLLQFFAREAHFPYAKNDVPPDVIRYLHQRNGARTAQQFTRLRQEWLALPGDATRCILRYCVCQYLRQLKACWPHKPLPGAP